jgi:transposase InsO family protein
MATHNIVQIVQAVQTVQAVCSNKTIVTTGTTESDSNQAWVADITYIRILKGFVFLAALLDCYSRKVIGWAISQRIDAELCLAALKSALAKRQPHRGVFITPIAACNTPVGSM